MVIELNPDQRRAADHLHRLKARLEAPPPSLARRLRAQFRQPPPTMGVYLWGGVGRGKTMLMDSFYESLRVPARERTHFYRFMRRVHADLRAMTQHTNPLDAVAAAYAQRVRILCLDEFFVADIADAMILAGLFEGLFKRGVTLIATSNVPPRDLYKDGLQRQRFLPAIDLIERHVETVHLDGGIDYRLLELEQAPTYLDSTLPDSASRLAQRFAALSDGSRAGPGILHIEGRPIAARATAAGLVWFEFADLCEGPRGQNDYIELARAYHTIFIANVPVFTGADENAARRFIMAVDEFYDRRVNLVVSAAAAPQALYQGDSLRFEFERTASRLVEMQTQHYLAGAHRP